MILPRERFQVYIHSSTEIPEDCTIGPFTIIGWYAKGVAARLDE